MVVATTKSREEDDTPAEVEAVIDSVPKGEEVPIPNLVVEENLKSSVMVLKLSEIIPKARSLPKVVEA